MPRRSLYIQLAALLVVVSAFALGGVRLSSADSRPNPWPDGKISYYNASGWKAELRTAVRQWNRLDFGVQFIPTRNLDRAELIIGNSRQFPCDNCWGQAEPLGYQYGTLSAIWLKTPETVSLNQNNVYTETIIHELGHVLGLEHPADDSGCAQMNSGPTNCALIYQAHFDKKRQLRYGCGPFPADLEQLAELYSLEEVPETQPFCTDPYWNRD